MPTKEPRKRPSITVTYEDGSEETFNPNKPKFLLAMEKKFKIQVPETHEQLYWLAWFALGEQGGSYEKWVDGVEYVDENDTPGEQALGEPQS